MIWDGRGYFCDACCLPESDHTKWTELVQAHHGVPKMANELHEAVVTHLMLSRSDVDFILQHDPGKQHLRALTYFLDQFQPSCTRSIYSDSWTELYEISCP